MYFGPEVTRSGLLILPATLHTESRRRIRTEIALGLAAVVLNVPYDEDSPKVLALAEKWGAPPLPSTANGVDYRIHNTPYMMEYNLNVERELGSGTVLTVGYVGSKGNHLMVAEALNSPVPFIGADGHATYATLVNGKIVYNPRSNPNFSVLETAGALGVSTYNSLQASLTHQMRCNWQLQVSYTYSHSLDDGSGQTSLETLGTPQGTQDPSCPICDYGRSTFDRRHALRINSVVTLPFHGNQLVEGWQLSGIFSYVSAPPFTVTDGFDQAGIAGTVNTDDRPNWVPGCGGGPVIFGNPHQWFNPACYSLPPVGELGNLGRNTVNGPNLLNTDFAVMKDTRIAKISEAFHIQFRAELFNIFNHPNFSVPFGSSGVIPVFAAGPNGTGKVSSAAGLITSTTTSSRQIQFGLKFVF